MFKLFDSILWKKDTDKNLKRKRSESSSDEKTSTKLKSYEYPSVLFITTHAEYKNPPVTYTSPINIEKINAVTLGVCNSLTSDFAHDMAYQIINEINEGEVVYMKKGSEKIRDILKSSDTEIHFVKSVKPLIDKDIAYISTTEAGKGYQIHSIKKGDTVLDREYTVIPIDRLDTDTPFFNTVTLLTKPPYDDLIQKIIRRSNIGEAQTVKLSDILQYLEEEGIENVIIVDLTCASISGQTRGFRLMARNKIGYKKIKLSKKHKKYKKHKGSKSKGRKDRKTKKTKKLKTPKKVIYK